MNDRVTVPKGASRPPVPPRKEVDLERILDALQTMDKNAGLRAADLKVYLFALPIIWGVIWGLLYVLYLVTTSR